MPASSDICWLERTAADVPIDDDWLSSEEKTQLRTLVIPKRRLDWRLGRWTIKCAVSAFEQLCGLECAIKDVEVAAAVSGAPFLQSPRTGLSVSVSHCSGAALSAVAHHPNAVGCDLELIEPRSYAFVRDFFTPDEQLRIATGRTQGERDLLTTVFWSAKESALKALRLGLRLDTRNVMVKFGLLAQTGDHAIDRASLCGWTAITIATTDHGTLCGWWNRNGSFIRTLVAPSLHFPFALTC